MTDSVVDAFDHDLALADEHWRSSRLAKAERICRRLLRSQPKAAAVHRLLGVIAYTRGDLDQAIACHRQACASADAPAIFCAALAELCRRRGLLAEAEAAGRDGVARDPTLAQAWQNLGLVLFDAGNLPDSLDCLERAVALAPDVVEAHVNLGNVLQKLRRPEAAVECYRRALELDDNNAEAHGNYASALAALGRHDEARSHVNRALALKPREIAFHIASAMIEAELGRAEEAAALYKRAIALQSDLVVPWSNLAVLKTFTSDDPDLTAMEQVLAAKCGELDRLRLHFALGKAYADAGAIERAFAHFAAGNRLKRRSLDYNCDGMARWMASIAETSSAPLFDRLKGAGASSEVPVFIIGMPRSGTSLIEQILCSHPLIHGAGECSFVDNIARSLRDGSGAERPYPSFVPALSGPLLEALGQRYLSQITALAPEALRVIDKMPGNFLYAGLIHLMLPRARIIHCRRDPVDTCFSCYARLFADGQNFSYDLVDLGRHYASYTRLMAHWRTLLPREIFTEVDYEAVIDDLEGEARRLISFCGLPWDDACLRYYENGRPVRTASMIQVRRPVYSTSRGGARRFLPYIGPLIDALGASD
jgi:tetratricopeptide (TPR) repeat protein